METRLAKLEAIIPTLATREDLAKQKADETMERIDRLIASLSADFDRKHSEIKSAILELRKDFDRKFTFLMIVQFAILFAIIGLLSKITNIF
jgi:uncharacterized membrane protein YqjE